MQFDLLAKPPLKTDAVAVANDSMRIINSGSIDGCPISSIEGRQLLPELSQYPTYNRIDV